MTIEPKIRVSWVGAEREPVVVIDDFSRRAEQFRAEAAARSGEFVERGEFHPGPRMPVGADYFAAVGPVVRGVAREFFDIREELEVLVSNFSISTKQPCDLSLAQRIPHVDAYDERQIAIVHFLSIRDLGGTAFFRQRSTGFETVNGARARAYLDALAADMRIHGEPPAAYVSDDSKLFERTFLGEHRLDRALIYRGALLHCAWLRETPELPADPLEGRLTVASFLRPVLRRPR